MISRTDYKLAGHRRTYEKAKDLKRDLKQEGFRVKIRPDFINGGYNIFSKDIRAIDDYNHGHHRRRGVRA